MILELHLLQSFPVSNLNRDDVGQPKSATFGGVPRARISSQCLKRSARNLFTEYGLDVSDCGNRTKRLVSAACQVLEARGKSVEETQDLVTAGLHQLGFGVENSGLTQYLLFVGHEAALLLADFCDENWDALAVAIAADKKEQQKKKGDAGAKTKKKKPAGEYLKAAQRIFNATRAADIALFGRMIADNKDFSVNAASQVAHALSTHAVAIEFDYYTAVDDLKPNGEPGADMIGTIDFNAACYYRYANLDLNQLADNLEHDTDLVTRAATAWLGAFIHATPSGKQTTTAARTMPDTLLGTVRDRGAWNLANAFLRPVTGSDLMAVSTDRMLQHFANLRSFYGRKDILAAAGASISGDTTALPDDETVTSVDEFTDRLLATALA